MIEDHWKRTKMLTKVFQRNLTRWGYVKPLIKPNSNPPWEKPRKKHHRATYNMSFRKTF